MKEVTPLLDAKPVFDLAIPQWTKPVERAGTPAAAPSMIARLANLLPAAGPIKKVQDYLKLPMAISVAFKTRPGQRDAVKRLWDDQVRQRAQGNAAESNYVYAFDMKDENVIRISVVFDATDAFHQMAHAKWFKAYMKAVTLLLDGRPEYQMATPQWIK